MGFYRKDLENNPKIMDEGKTCFGERFPALAPPLSKALANFVILSLALSHFNVLVTVGTSILTISGILSMMLLGFTYFQAVVTLEINLMLSSPPRSHKSRVIVTITLLEYMSYR